MGYRYIGAKTRILEEILNRISTLIPKGGHVIDLMCGTASVSSALRKREFRVTANDIMTFSVHHAKVALLFTSKPEFKKAKVFINTFIKKAPQSLLPMPPYEKMLHAINNVQPQKGYFWKEFSVEGSPNNTKKPRNYFSPENAKKIDGIRKQIKNMHQDKQLSSLEHSLLLHDLIMAANDVANIAGTYGHYLSRLVGRAKTKIQLKPSLLYIKKDSGQHNVIQGYAEEVAGKMKGDLCYIDPPYMKRQYAANYHVLETLAREDEPEAIGVSGLRPWRDQYSNFCTKTKIQDSFKQIFSQMACPNFLISYSQDGLLKIDELLMLLSGFGKTQVYNFKNKRFKSNDSKLDSKLTEYILHLNIRK